MSVSLTEEVMAQGDWSVDLDYSTEVAAELLDDTGRPKKCHALIYDPASTLTYCGVLLRVAGDEQSGLTIGGRGLVWWLGAGSEGPTITDREFVSGNNKLSNDLTPSTIAELNFAYWRYAQDTGWILTPSNVFHNGVGSADADDILQSDETFECLPGQLYTFSAALSSGALTGGGRIRVRTVYEGLFATPDLSQPYSAWPASTVGDIATMTDPLGVIAGDVLRIHSGAGNPIANGTFDDGGVPNLNGWYIGAGNWYADGVNGNWGGVGHAYTDTSVASAYKWLQSSQSGNTSPVVAYPVTAGDEYEMRLVARASPSFGVSGTDGEVFFSMGEVNSSFAVRDYQQTEHMHGDDASAGTGWRILLKRFTIPDGVYSLVPSIIVLNQTIGQWDFDSATLLRTAGNVDTRTGPGFAVTPKRSYTWKLPFRSDAGTTGTAQMRLVCFAADRPNVILQGPTLEDTGGTQHTTAWTFQSPSGYDFIQQQIWSSDVANGSYYLGQGTITDDDPTTSVLDGLSGAASTMGGGGTVTSYGAVPDGAERLRVELVAENLAGEWAAGTDSLVRSGVTPSTSGDVAAALLVDPVTGSQLLTAGTITGAEVIPFDWYVRNMTLRDALDHLCTAVAEPRREYRVNPDRTLDFGTAEEICTDHAAGGASPIVLLPEDRDVGPAPFVQANAEERPTAITVIGADRKLVNGSTIPRIATAPVPGVTEVDWNGAPVNRPRIIADGTVDGLGYAQALATDQAAQQVDPPQSLTIALSGANTRPAFREGDWVYVYHPEGGLVDLTNPTVIDGRTVFPKKVRILTRKRECGPGYTVVIRRTDGSTFALPGVNFSAEDSTTLTLGERPPDFISDPQGGDVGNQYLRDRASRPR